MQLRFLFLLNIIIVFSVYFYSCSGTQNKNNDKSKYNFILYDTSENELIDGILNIESSPSNKIFGKYEITKKIVDTIKGISSSKGYFEGKKDDSAKTVFINMNPKIADANLFFNARIVGDSLIGDWNYSTMKGRVQYGKFKAVLTN